MDDSFVSEIDSLTLADGTSSGMDDIIEDIFDHEDPLENFSTMEDVGTVLELAESPANDKLAPPAETPPSPDCEMRIQADNKKIQLVEAVLSITESAAGETLSSRTGTISPLEPSTQTPEAPLDIIPATAVMETGEDVEAPSVMKILSFAIPAIGVWLCSPLLSLIDTSAVGLLSGTIQQAALGPAVAVCDYAALLNAFLFTATTNLVAEAYEKDRGNDEKPRTTRAMAASLQLSTFVGTAIGAALFVGAKTLLKLIIGNDSIDPGVFAAATRYARIRALGMPAAAIIGSAQAACLGMQDVKSPLYVLLAAAVVNFFGDVLLVRQKHAWLGGAAGAAWATSASQYAAVAIFLRWLCFKPKKPAVVMNISRAIMELTGPKGSDGLKRRLGFQADLEAYTNGIKNHPMMKHVSLLKSRLPRLPKRDSKPSFSTQGFLEGRFNARSLVSPPKREDAEEFLPYVVPVTTTTVGKVSSYIAMNHVVSSSFGTLAMAAQQVVVSLFYCLTPIGDSLSLTAQSFVPVIEAKKKSKERTNALRMTLRNLLKAGGVFGGLTAAFVALIPLFSHIFTADAMVATQINSVVPLLMGVFSLHGVLLGAEGILLGRNRVSLYTDLFEKEYCLVGRI
eukprot:CAMPEP_0118725534 /NCGR_PEP_ID=MMETSP0800-20121206/33194_1 /TAXON_ID=210618 ORGANISM="Striatella unipunctata, Strain CCMP2910" /NCGR_SAMPLE_ID=MMETSP0800 /ASSEMBLY_ACC=CAM_ASM_000638 /LENGTH=622 /DNA_ID=CAMNT_0006634245 /DNA_START=146 /DNA_END=2014 /DNA_ORIENTATION=-